MNQLYNIKLSNLCRVNIGWKSKITLLLLGLLASTIVTSQSNIDFTEEKLQLLEPSPKFDQRRFNIALGATGVTFTTFAIGLNNVWYAQYEREGFHLFNDWHEWQQMDKAGHAYTSYIQSHLWYQGSRWTGLEENKSIMIGAIAGTLFQSTVEVLDGFSTEWGFSLGDMGFNMVGVSSFWLQQKYWGDQRIKFKMSSFPKSYETGMLQSAGGDFYPSSLDERANQLFGENYLTSFLKDYNAQTIWTSISVASFLHKDSRWPDWLNIAIGYGAENMYGGFENRWKISDENFMLSETEYPRYRQFYLALDLDLDRFKPKSHFLRTLFSILNVFKTPSPAVEITTRGEVLFHFIHL